MFVDSVHNTMKMINQERVSCAKYVINNTIPNLKRHECSVLRFNGWNTAYIRAASDISAFVKKKSTQRFMTKYAK